MRSRDGNSNLALTICSVILLNSLVLNAKEYLISYRYIVKDATLHSELLYISDAMQKCKGKEEKPLILISDDNDTIRETISKNSEEFIDYMHKLGLHVEHREVTKNYINHSTTTLTLKTTCFKVDFNENLVKIAPLK